jgi:hypothetical protein
MTNEKKTTYKPKEKNVVKLQQFLLRLEDKNIKRDSNEL